MSSWFEFVNTSAIFAMCDENKCGFLVKRYVILRPLPFILFNRSIFFIGMNDGGTGWIGAPLAAIVSGLPNGVKKPPKDGVIIGVMAGTSSTRSSNKSKLDFCGGGGVGLDFLFSCPLVEFLLYKGSAGSLLSLTLSSDAESLSLSSLSEDDLWDFFLVLEYEHH